MGTYADDAREYLAKAVETVDAELSKSYALQSIAASLIALVDKE